MKVLIFGVAGFVGSSLAERLVESEIEVIGVDDLSYGYIERIDSLGGRFFSFYNCTLEEFCKNKEVDIDAVVNCAAIAPLPENQIDHYRSIVQNVATCGAIVDFCCKNGIKKLLHFSSSAVYENGTSTTGTPALESDELSPRLMYPVSKYLSEEYLRSQYLNYELDVVCMRLFNLYGPRQDYFRKQPPLLGYLIKNIICGTPITLFASENARRDYIYIDDLVDFITVVLNEDNKVRFRTPNVGSGKNYSVYELVKILERCSNRKLKYGRGSTKEFWGRYSELFDRKISLDEKLIRREIDKMAVADINKTKEEFAWEPKVSIEAGIEACYEYAKETI